VASEQATAVESLTDLYNEQMAKQMHWSNPFEYHFDRGLYFHEVSPNLFCGTQPRNPEEVLALANLHDIRTIVNLQQDGDMQYWGVDFGANERACHEHGVRLVRTPARDFDPDSLRNMLPRAVRAVVEGLDRGDRVYVHCTAGLGRAPGVCIAYLYWYADRHSDQPLSYLDDSYRSVTTTRPCGPKKDAVRGATFDLLKGHDNRPFEHLPDHAWATLSRQDMANIQDRVRHA